MTHPARFITLEGIDGAGKTSHVATLAAYLAAQNVDVVLTREPGGTPLGEQLRSLLLDPAAALRAHVETVVFRGPGSSGWVRLAGGERLELDFGPGQLPEIGAEIGLAWHDPAPVRFAD